MANMKIMFLVLILLFQTNFVLANDASGGTSYSSEDEIKKWAIAAVREIMTYNYQNYEERMEKNSSYFTESGWSGFSGVMKKINTKDKVTKEKLSVMSFQSDLAEVCNIDEKEDRQIWSVVVPVKTIYLSDGNKKKASRTVLIFIQETKLKQKHISQRTIDRWMGRGFGTEKPCDWYEEVVSFDKTFNEDLKSLGGDPKVLWKTLEDIDEIMESAEDVK